MHRKKKKKVRRTEVFNLLTSTLYRETHFLSYDGHLNLFFILTFPFLEIRISLFMRRKFPENKFRFIFDPLVRSARSIHFSFIY